MTDNKMLDIEKTFQMLRGDDVEQLSGQDAAFYYAETTKMPMHVGSIAIYDPSTAPGGQVRVKDILSFIEKRLHRSKSFTRKLHPLPMNVDHPYWVEDEDFDLEFHVRHIALPKPGDWRQLMILASRLHSRPLDLTRPPWEFWIVKGLDNIANVPKGSYAIISKVHHSAIDGLSGVEMMQATHSISPNDLVAEIPVDMKRKRSPSTAELLARSQVNAITNPISRIQHARRLAPGALKYLAGVRKR